MREEMLYILRLWRDGDAEHAWRASLEDVRTKRRNVFANIEVLHAFLDECTAHGVQPEGEEE